MVSVLMLAYNHGPYIRESILSIVAQRTTFPFELLVGEDCSTDNTRAIVAELVEAHPDKVRLITSATNVGMHNNGRRLEDAARGKYVAFCEGDDYWHDEHKLERQVAFLEAHPDYVMSHTDYRMLYTQTGRLTGGYLGQQDCGDDARAYESIIAGRRSIGTLTVCIRRHVLEEVRKAPECYESRFLMGDTQRWLEAARMGKVHYDPQVTATRRALPESATRSSNPERLLRFARSSRDLFEHYLAKYPSPPEAAYAARRRSAVAVLRCAFAARDRNEAVGTWRSLVALGGRVPWLARLYYFGTWSALARTVAVQLIRCAQWQESIARQLRRWRDRPLRAPGT
jgi:glycosyltransferase involved in cell wall biosynthesis